MSDDAELVATARAGGPQDFGPVVRRYQDAVFGVALARLGSYHDAQDVAQEVFVDAYRRLGTLRDPSRLGAWLRSIAIHKCIDHQRRRRGDVAIDDTAEPASAQPQPDAALERRELRHRVLAAIGRLSRTQRETTTLFYIDGYSVAEVAAIQEVPVGTVKWRLHAARETLKEEMLTMVEDVLKSEAPRDDLAQRVLAVLSEPGSHDCHEMIAELRRIGAEGALDGFLSAAESPHAATRKHAVDFVGLFDAPEHRERVVGLLKEALEDPNQSVRCGALLAALEGTACGDEVTRQELVPAVVELLFDRAKAVRLRAAWALRRGWAAHVPVEAAARALLDEPNHVVRQAKEELLRAVLDARGPRAEPIIGAGDVDERLARLEHKLASPSSAVRASAAADLLYLPMHPRRKREEIVPLVVGLLRDRSKRVRWRAAYELTAWPADVPLDAVERACRAETHAGPRQQMQELLRRATDAQDRT